MLTKKNIIIITYHMIPYTKIWGASQRMYYLGNQLIEHGYNVTVIHANFGLFPIENKKINFNSIKVDIKFKFFQKFQEKMQLISINNTHNDIVSFKIKILISILNLIIKPFIRKLETFLFNDYGYIGFFVYLWSNEVKKILTNFLNKNDKSIIIISGPYFTSFRILKYIKRNYKNVFCVLDYRDPWNLLNKSSIISKYNEKSLLNEADLVTVFSDKFKASMIDYFKIDQKKFLTLYNGFDFDIWEKLDYDLLTHKYKLLPNNKFTISYVGSHITFKDGSGRDPALLIQAISSSLNSEFIELNLVGCHDYPQSKLFDNSKATINYYPVVSHDIAIRFLKFSDVTVVLGTDLIPSKFTVTGKIFDCIRSGSYILGISNSDDVDYIQIINKLNVGTCSKNDLESLKAKIDDLFCRWEDNKLKRRQIHDIFKYSRQYQNSKLLTVLNNY